MTIAYLTDVEGMWSRVETFCADNALVHLRDGQIELADGVTFVFGGDAVDRGPFGRKVLAALLAAKARYGPRVVLLAGNRDINKLRLPRELSGSPPPKAPPEVREDRAVLLRWILEHTMGAKAAFEHRRVELGGAGDGEIVQSFLDDVEVGAGGGMLLRFLQSAQLAWRHGGTLFVHGAVSEESLGTVPGRDGRVDDVDAWATALNDWYHSQVDAYVTGGVFAPLIQYQAPAPGSRTNPRSVVYGRNGDDLNNPALPSAGVVDALARNGVTRVVVGHTPSGDSPSILRDGAGFELVCADNSYGRHERGNKVWLSDDGLLGVDAEAILDDGRVVRVRRIDDPSVGMRTADTGHLLKGVTDDGEYLLFRYLPGYKFEQLTVTLEELVRRELSVPRG